MTTEIYCAVDNCAYEKEGKCSKETIKISYTEDHPDNTEETCCMSFRDERQYDESHGVAQPKIKG